MLGALIGRGDVVRRGKTSVVPGSHQARREQSGPEGRAGLRWTARRN
jgi:hypothetical protein